MRDLGTLLGGYLNQDWPEDYMSVWDAVARFRLDADSELLEKAHGELVDLLDKGLGEKDLLDVLLDKYDTGYWPPGSNTTATEFLTRLERELRPSRSDA